MSKDMVNIRLKPQPGIILVEPQTVQPEKSQVGQVTLSRTASEKDQLGKVLAVGDPIPYESNPKIYRQTNVKVGDLIHHRTWSEDRYTTTNGVVIKHIKFEDVLSIEEEENAS